MVVFGLEIKEGDVGGLEGLRVGLRRWDRDSDWVEAGAGLQQRSMLDDAGSVCRFIRAFFLRNVY